MNLTAHVPLSLAFILTISSKMFSSLDLDMSESFFVAFHKASQFNLSSSIVKLCGAGTGFAAGLNVYAVSNLNFELKFSSHYTASSVTTQRVE